MKMGFSLSLLALSCTHHRSRRKWYNKMNGSRRNSSDTNFHHISFNSLAYMRTLCESEKRERHESFKSKILLNIDYQLKIPFRVKLFFYSCLASQFCLSDFRSHTQRRRQQAALYNFQTMWLVDWWKKMGRNKRGDIGERTKKERSASWWKQLFVCVQGEITRLCVSQIVIFIRAQSDEAKYKWL